VTRIDLPDEAATLALGRALALSLPDGWDRPTALLQAELGSGKTTLARGFVSALPGAQDAEVASPSFNLANVYPTKPPVVHMDLYRLGEGALDDGLEELLEAGHCPGQVALVEWAQFLPGEHTPRERLDIRILHSGAGRLAELTAHGENARRWLTRTLETFYKSG